MRSCLRDGRSTGLRRIRRIVQVLTLPGSLNRLVRILCNARITLRFHPAGKFRSELGFKLRTLRVVRHVDQFVRIIGGVVKLFGRSMRVPHE